MKILSVTFFIVFVCLAQQVEIQEAPVQSQDTEWLQYDDGTAHWLTWQGTYRGVWFNVEDFIPGATCFPVEAAELWFYHHSNYSWDTSDTIIELWNGDYASGPDTLLSSSQITAVHFAPVYAEYEPAITADADFWCIQNTELSSGGWPSILGDNMQGTVNHSFLSDDFIIWEPWEVSGGVCNYFIRITDDWDPTSLERTTWGEVKTSF
jgi:hypothetical protein